MKKQQQQIQDPSFSLSKTESDEKDFMYVIPPGVRFNDIYMDVADIQRELGIGRRTIYNMRNEGKLSYTTLNDGKSYFFRQEIAAILKENTVVGKNSIWKKLGVSNVIATFSYLVS